MLALQLTGLQGGFYQVMNADLEAVCVPPFTEVEQSLLGDLVTEALGSDAPDTCSARVDELVNGALGLSPNEVDLLDAWHRSSTLGRGVDEMEE